MSEIKSSSYLMANTDSMYPLLTRFHNTVHIIEPDTKNDVDDIYNQISYEDIDLFFKITIDRDNVVVQDIFNAPNRRNSVNRLLNTKFKLLNN